MSLDRNNDRFGSSLRAIHRNREIPELSAGWKDNVMFDIIRQGTGGPMTPLLRLPVPVTVGLAAASVMLAVIAIQFIAGLNGQMTDSTLITYSAYPSGWIGL